MNIFSFVTFLFQKEIFAIREQLEDSELSQDELQMLYDDVSKKYNCACDTFGNNFSNHDSNENLQNILNKMKYYRKVMDEIEMRL